MKKHNLVIDCILYLLVAYSTKKNRKHKLFLQKKVPLFGSVYFFDDGPF
jgi:hypothetical protein